MVPTMAQVPSGAVAPVWRTSRFRIDLRRPRVMGVVNLTPDSFSDGGRFRKPGDAVSHCETLLAQGADLLDLGAESSRPGSREIDGEEEWVRLEPVLRDVVRLNVPISIDTHRSQTMQRCLLYTSFFRDHIAPRYRSTLGYPQAGGVFSKAGARLSLHAGGLAKSGQNVSDH